MPRGAKSIASPERQQGARRAPGPGRRSSETRRRHHADGVPLSAALGLGVAVGPCGARPGARKRRRPVASRSRPSRSAASSRSSRVFERGGRPARRASSASKGRRRGGLCSCRGRSLRLSQRAMPASSPPRVRRSPSSSSARPVAGASTSATSSGSHPASRPSRPPRAKAKRMETRRPPACRARRHCLRRATRRAASKAASSTRGRAAHG